MISKIMRPAAVTAFCVVLAGFLLFGREFFSYVRTSSRAVQAAVKENVSVEFELQRAKDLVEDILPKMQANVRMIAEDEVEIAALERDIEAGQSQLEQDREQLASLRSQLNTQQVSFRSKGRSLTREELAEQLAHQFERYRESELILESKQRLLETRQDSLHAAMQMFERTKHQKIQLEQKIESLVAQHRLVQASARDGQIHGVRADTSDAEKLLADIQRRLDVSQRIMEHQADLIPDRLTQQTTDEATVLAEFDDYFEGNSPQSDHVAVSP